MAKPTDKEIVAYVKATVIKNALEEETIKSGKKKLMAELQSVGKTDMTIVVDGQNLKVNLVTPKQLDEKKAIAYFKSKKRTDLIEVVSSESLKKADFKAAVDNKEFPQADIDALYFDGTTQVRTSGDGAKTIKEKALGWVKKTFASLY